MAGPDGTRARTTDEVAPAARSTTFSHLCHWHRCRGLAHDIQTDILSCGRSESHGNEEYRVLYLATRPEAVYVLHAFGKKRQGTPKLDVNLARARLKELPRLRNRD